MNNMATGSSFDDFLEEENLKEEVESGAIKKIIAYQLQEKIKEEHLTKAEATHKSPAEIIGQLVRKELAETAEFTHVEQ